MARHVRTRNGVRLAVKKWVRMSLHNLMQWMADTKWSVGLHESRYAYSIIESVHVWTLCIFVGFAVLLDLRLLGVTLKRVPVSHIVTRLLPWTKASFVIMVISGVLLFYAIPLRTYHNVFFRAKAVLLLLATLNAWLFHNGQVYRGLAEWDSAPATPRAAKLAGAFSLALWSRSCFRAGATRSRSSRATRSRGCSAVSSS
jgi:hypothetical protein